MTRMGDVPGKAVTEAEHRGLECEGQGLTDLQLIDLSAPPRVLGPENRQQFGVMQIHARVFFFIRGGDGEDLGMPLC